MRRLLLLLVGCMLAASAVQAADGYPARPLRLIVPYPAGGPLDAVARLAAQKVSAQWGQPVVVENKAGAGGNIGADMVAKAAPDGYTLLIGAVATHAINPRLYPSMPYDAQRDFQPVTQLASTPNVLIVNPSLRVHDVRELVAYAKAHPATLNFASGSTGSAGHLAGELFKRMAGIEMVHVPYRGAGPALQDVVAGEVLIMFDNLASARGQIRAGKVRALAVTTAQRSALAPELPTIAESGLPGFDINTWFGLFLPAHTPKPIVDRVHDAFVRALEAPDVRETMAALGAEPVTSTPDEFARYIASEARKYAEVIETSGARAD
jgi:tripartite-type tricarboxylate transporter receptor subunit TctC